MQDKNRVGALDYTSLTMKQANIRFVESEKVPRDGTVIDHTWQYVNKNGGGPDKRYKDNRQLPIVNYSEISFKSNTGLNERIQVSKADAGKNLDSYITSYSRNQFLKIDTEPDNQGSEKQEPQLQESQEPVNQGV